SARQGNGAAAAVDAGARGARPARPGPRRAALTAAASADQGRARAPVARGRAEARPERATEVRRVSEAAPQRDLGDRRRVLAPVLEVAAAGLEPLREHVSGHAVRLVAEGVVQLAAAAVELDRDRVDRQPGIAQAARDQLLDALAQRLALRR